MAYFRGATDCQLTFFTGGTWSWVLNFQTMSGRHKYQPRKVRKSSSVAEMLNNVAQAFQTILKMVKLEDIRVLSWVQSLGLL